MKLLTAEKTNEAPSSGGRQGFLLTSGRRVSWSLLPNGGVRKGSKKKVVIQVNRGSGHSSTSQMPRISRTGDK